uniref:Uncharacterized protein LOC102805799 n=1 Tax=Saccoglossus kowalevskii TaxID=10224 RepID=A0ABM0M2K9_SACKO
MPDTQAEESITRLKLTRRGQRAHMTKLFTRAEEVIDKYSEEADKTTAYNLLVALNKQLSDKYHAHNATEEKILNLTNEANYDTVSEASCDSQSEIYKRNHRITTFIENHRPNTGSNNGASGIDHTPRGRSKNTIALPKLQLQTFDGNTLEWVSFFDLFKSSIHEDTSLDNIQKFTYLRSLLTGKASHTISGLALTEANYKHAVDLLVARYGQKHLLIDAHMTALWQLRQPCNDIISLRHFYDSIESNVRGLQSLGKNESTYGELLVPMIRDKLPANIRQQIARDRGDVAWNLPDLRKAILREINVLRAGCSLEELSIVNAPNPPEITAAFHTHVSTGQTSKSQQEPRHTRKVCPFCKGAHHAAECRVINDTRQRLDIIRKNRQCFNCFGKHRVADCKSRYTCRICKRKHHTSLHFEESASTSSPAPSQTKKSQTADATTEVITVNFTKVSPLPDKNYFNNDRCQDQYPDTLATKPKNAGPVLLKTAIVPISVRNDQPINAV